MPNNLIASVEYGGYVAVWKVLFFLIAFAGWAPMVNWIFTDTQAVRTNTFFWTLIIALAGVAALFLWLLVPVFVIGLLLYLVILGGVSMAYVIHRNARVAEFEKVLTGAYFRGLFINPGKKIQKASRGISFITVNGNEVPLPEPKSQELEGFMLACDVVDDAVWHRASVVRFVPQKEDYAVVYEIDGVTTKQNPRTRDEVDHFVYYAKQLAGLEVEEKRKPQKGRFTAVLPENKRTAWEVSTSGSTAGEQVRLERVSELVSRKIPDLGLNENQLEEISTLRDLKKGLVIVSGPAKSGVTTTFYTLLGNHDPFLNNINTLEKNPAAELPNITQIPYALSDTGTSTYSRRLQSVLRRGPDIVGVAECEDAQTAQLCCAGAKDGRVMYVGMQANSVNEAMEMWLKWVGDKNLIADTLEAIVNQRLVRKLCDDCRQAYQPNPALFKKFNLPPGDARMFYRPGEIEYDKHGKPIICQTCQGTGFFGRVGLFETIRITSQLREVIRKAKSSQEIATAFRRAGMLYMQEQSIKKVSESVTSINEVIRNFATKP
ncbi:MAG: Flp pilus assembly complex ATPase component TadA [Planctomycetales bacterium]|nr:Flp pilus assembly complex ATPase component TadA [Planctomycetales bacterium]